MTWLVKCTVGDCFGSCFAVRMGTVPGRLFDERDEAIEVMHLLQRSIDRLYREAGSDRTERRPRNRAELVFGPVPTAGLPVLWRK